MTYKNNGLSSCRKHPSYYSDELKQRLAASASQPGISLSTLAQEQGVSVSALSRWRKQYHQPAAAPLILIARELSLGAESLALPSGVIEVTLEFEAFVKGPDLEWRFIDVGPTSIALAPGKR